MKIRSLLAVVAFAGVITITSAQACVAGSRLR